MEKETISITLTGKINHHDYGWKQWYDDAKEFIKSIGYDSTHFNFNSTKNNSGKIVTLKRSEKKFISAVETGEEIASFSLYSLPNNYESASFDYNVLIVRNSEYISLIMNKSDYQNVSVESVINTMGKYIFIDSYEIYEMDRYECPLIYASKSNPITQFQSLKILKK